MDNINEKINDEVMPIVDDIKSKMDKLQDRYKFKLDFAFPEISLEEIIGESPKNK